jgi:uncharacterized protein (TIGR03435 family)
MRRCAPALALACCSLFAQAPAPVDSFEVASIRPAAPGKGDNIATDPGSLTMRNVTLHRCLEWAYDLQKFQVSGPAWLDDERFDIAAHTSAASSESRRRLMLQTLLAERFAVKVHKEQKEMSVFLLVTAKNGPKFHEEGTKDASKFVESGSQTSQFGKDRKGLTYEGIRLADLALQLSDPMERPVIDKTGLTGRYDIRLDVSALQSSASGRESKDDVVNFILTGFQSQLGLQLKPGREKLDVLVIDSANQQPTGN